MAVTRFGGTMEFAARHFLETHGFEPGKDIVLIQIGISADVVPAMTNGLVQSEVMSVPYLFIARRLGVRELADLSQTGVRYAQAALVAKRSFLRDKREIVGVLSDRRSRRSIILRRSPLCHAGLGSIYARTMLTF
jgi:ABC-type nitrate/sulfonate/bicarbonate transport system substrate-binding protein